VLLYIFNIKDLAAERLAKHRHNTELKKKRLKREAQELYKEIQARKEEAFIKTLVRDFRNVGKAQRDAEAFCKESEIRNKCLSYLEHENRKIAKHRAALAAHTSSQLKGCSSLKTSFNKKPSSIETIGICGEKSVNQHERQHLKLRKSNSNHSVSFTNIATGPEKRSHKSQKYSSTEHENMEKKNLDFVEKCGTKDCNKSMKVKCNLYGTIKEKDSERNMQDYQNNGTRDSGVCTSEQNTINEFGEINHHDENDCTEEDVVPRQTYPIPTNLITPKKASNKNEQRSSFKREKPSQMMMSIRLNESSKENDQSRFIGSLSPPTKREHKQDTLQTPSGLWTISPPSKRKCCRKARKIFLREKFNNKSIESNIIHNPQPKDKSIKTTLRNEEISKQTIERPRIRTEKTEIVPKCIFSYEINHTLRPYSNSEYKATKADPMKRQSPNYIIRDIDLRKCLEYAIQSTIVETHNLLNKSPYHDSKKRQKKQNKINNNK